MVDLVRAGRNPDDLAREFEPSGHSIRAWVAQADRNEGRREEAAPGLSAFERDELTRLADSGGSRPRIRDDVAHHSDLISLGVPR